uniref:Uncharacterized protein n=1 Tax=Vespula pensylvanica TaxID=30213 RepID=A0A834N0I4_VESPE|nr:hypothetical protein H0235_017219 [Vespula pensylvanica]
MDKRKEERDKEMKREKEKESLKRISKRRSKPSRKPATVWLCGQIIYGDAKLKSFAPFEKECRDRSRRRRFNVLGKKESVAQITLPSSVPPLTSSYSTIS